MYSPQANNGFDNNKHITYISNDNSYKRLLDFSSKLNMNNANQNLSQNSINNVNNNLINKSNKDINNDKTLDNLILKKEACELNNYITEDSLNKRYSNINEKEIDISADYNEIQTEINKLTINDLFNDNNNNEEENINNDYNDEENANDNSNFFKRCRFFSA